MRKGNEMQFSGKNERKAKVWLCHQNGGEDGHGVVLFT